MTGARTSIAPAAAPARAGGEDTAKTCGTCRYRGPQIEVNDLASGEPRKTGHFLCDLIKQADIGVYRDGSLVMCHRRPPQQPAFVVDGSGYFAALCVADDFGCNRWAPTTPETQHV